MATSITFGFSMRCPAVGRRCLQLLLPAIFMGGSLFTGYGLSARPSPERADALLQKAVFAKSLAKNQEPQSPSNTFYPTDSVCLSLKFKGRPSKGIASAKFYLGEHLISEAKVDVAEVNRGVLFSIGSSTFVGFTLKPNNPFPISDKYRAETFFNAKPLGSYRFQIVPPTDAIPSKITEATLAKGVDANRVPIGPLSVYTARQPVYLALRGDLGIGTGVEVNWLVHGHLDPAGTKSLTATKNMPNTRFYFAFMPTGGWKPGKQEAVLFLNGNEAGRYDFTIK